MVMGEKPDRGKFPCWLVTGLSAVAALVIGILLGIGIAIMVVMLWFENTRGDGYAAFMIASIAAGMFVSMVAFAAMVTRHHPPSAYPLLAVMIPWLLFALYVTWGTCKSSFITWDNWRWILRSADQRIYELDWIIRGWLSILVSALMGLLVSRAILNMRRNRGSAPTTG